MDSSLINIETVVLLPEYYVTEQPGLANALEKFAGNKHQVSTNDVNIEQLLTCEGGIAIVVTASEDAGAVNDLVKYFGPLLSKLVVGAKERKIKSFNLTIIRKVGETYNAVKMVSLAFLYEFVSLQIRLLTYFDFKNSVMASTARKTDIPNFALITSCKELDGLATAIQGVELLLCALSNSYESMIEDI